MIIIPSLYFTMRWLLLLTGSGPSRCYCSWSTITISLGNDVDIATLLLPRSSAWSDRILRTLISDGGDLDGTTTSPFPFAWLSPFLSSPIKSMKLSRCCDLLSDDTRDPKVDKTAAPFDNTRTTSYDYKTHLENYRINKYTWLPQQENFIKRLYKHCIFISNVMAHSQ